MAKEILTASLGGEPVSPEELAAVPDFASIRKEVWSKFPGAIEKRIYEPGEIIVREGEFGTTAFYILSGEADVYLQSRIAAVESHRRPKRRWFQGLTKITEFVTGQASRKHEEQAPERTHIPIDCSVDLPIDSPLAVLGAGEMFGELCALAAFKQEKVKRPKFYPRSATVRAKTRVVAFEMLPNILNNVFYNAPAFREKLNDNYRVRALDNHLRTVPVFKNLSQDFLDYLRQRVELVHCSPGQVICRQGEVADAFYLVRLGFVKVSREFPGGEMVLTYLSRSGYFGEMGLLPPIFQVVAKCKNREARAMLSRSPLSVGTAPLGEQVLQLPWDERLAPTHFQMAVEGGRVRVTRTANSNTSLVFRGEPFDSFRVQEGETFVAGGTTFEVHADYLGAGRRTATCTAIDFVQLVRIPAEDFAMMMEANVGVERAVTEVAHQRWEMDQQILKRVQKVSLDDFLQQELMQGQNLLLIDLDKCTRCDECVKACAATHEDGVTRLIRDGLRFDTYLVPTTCRACMDPLCMTRCPVGSIRRKESLDIVIEDWCIGCGNCAIDCPYGNINVVNLITPAGVTMQKAEPARPKATVCDLCADYPEPNCVRACPHDAAIRVEPKRFFSQELAGVQLAAAIENLGSTVPSKHAPEPAGDATPANRRVQILNGSRKDEILILQPETTFGRSPECTHSFPDQVDLSRVHCRILSLFGRLRIEDNFSTNGTFVNGNLIDGLDLRVGDVIELGEIQMQVLEGESVPGAVQ